jgi:hypothetical protein
MPATDYNKTVIYVIKCRDDNITEEYVGSTTNFRSRKNCHKSRCNNEKSKDYNFKIYEFIRANGNWDNWIMIQLEEYPCKNKREAELKEEQIRQERKAYLNSRRAIRTEEDRKNYEKMWYENNKEKNREHKKEYFKKWYQENKDEAIEKSKQRYEENKDEINGEKKLWYQKNKNERNEKRRQQYMENKDEINEKRRQKRAEKKVFMFGLKQPYYERKSI